MSKVFQYVVVLHPSDKEAEDGVQGKIVAGPETVCVKDEKAAGLAAARALPEEFDDKLDRVEVLVRPF